MGFFVVLMGAVSLADFFAGAFFAAVFLAAGFLVAAFFTLAFLVAAFLVAVFFAALAGLFLSAAFAFVGINFPPLWVNIMKYDRDRDYDQFHISRNNLLY